MKRMFLILVFAVMAAGSCFAQTRPAPVVDLYNERFTCYKEYGVNTSLAVTQSLYGKVRIVDINKECPDLCVWFVKWGDAHGLDVRVVNRTPDRFKGEWQFVTKKGEEDFTIALTDWKWADVFVLVTEGYDPQAKKYVKKK